MPATSQLLINVHFFILRQLLATGLIPIHPIINKSLGLLKQEINDLIPPVGDHRHSFHSLPRCTHMNN